MRDEILKIITNNPRHYTRVIKKNTQLMDWINQHTLIQSDKFIDTLYSAIYSETNVCSNGSVRSVSRFSEGWAGCGPAARCACVRAAISKTVSETKSSMSVETKAASNSKRKSTMLAKYGAEYNSQRPEIKSSISKPKISDDIYQLLIDRNWLETEYVTNQRSLTDIAQSLSIDYSTVGEYCRRHGFKIRQRTNYSTEERIVCDYLDSINILYERNNWDILGNKEIDIYIPGCKLGIEINGLYWHSYSPNSAHSTNENRYRHSDKTALANSAGVTLIQITDAEIRDKFELVKSLILAKVGKCLPVHARKTIIKEVTSADERRFLSQYHFQGYVPSTVCLGLYRGDQLVMIMSVGNSRYSKATEYELLRICTAPGVIVVGGAQKLFSKIKLITNSTSFVSYCDLSKFSGNVYSKIGFSLKSNTQPGYAWTDGTVLISRFKCQKRKLSKWLVGYDPDKSESENMFTAGYRRYWDCGQQTWTLA